MHRYSGVLFLFVLVSTFAFAQSPWSEIAENNITASGQRVIIPQKYKTFKLDNVSLLQVLRSAPEEFNSIGRNNSSVILHLPMPDGSFQRFSIFRSSIMEPGLQVKYPEIQTYNGQGIDDPYASIRLDYNPYSGFHGRILSPNGDVYIDPYQRGRVDVYQSYFQRDFKSNKQFSELPLRFVPGRQAVSNNRTATSAPCRGTQLYTYRAAVSCTGEYAQAVTGSMTPTVAATLAAIVTSVNRVTQVYERDLAIRLILIANNNIIVYTNPATDPYDGNDDGSVLLEESKDTIPVKIGNANFDIGHTFSTGGGGVAYLGVVCFNGYKAGGVTGSSNPTGDPFDIDYVAHEMGHQFGGNHTFRGEVGSCSGNGEPTTAYEPGSGTTIQAYAGICATDDMQPNSDPFFHVASYNEMVNYATAGDGNLCKGIIVTGNAIPVITAMNNNGVSIPVNTPFTLSANATDANGDALTYNWEQWDVGLVPLAWNNAVAAPDGPIFRSRVPKTTGSRTFPDIRVIVRNYPQTPPAEMNGLKGEVLPNSPRALSFKLSVRDNRTGGGGVATGGGKPADQVTGIGGVGCSFTTPFSINAVAGTFLVSFPNGGETVQGGSSQTITWANAGTNTAPINCMNVRIMLSIDSGYTYPYTLAASTPNDGSHDVMMPNINPTTNRARIKVEAADNIFFDISNAPFTLSYNAVLPVSMGEFTVKPYQRNKALLNWRTIQEVNNRGFEIERSIGNTTSFASVAFVNSAGNNSSGNSYSFINPDLPVNTTIYYRLKQIDIDGRSSYSDTRQVRFNSKGLYLSLQPNPVHSLVHLVNDGEPVEKADISFYDKTGRLVKHQTIVLPGARTELNISSLASGIYTVRIIVGDETITTKLVKQ